MLRNFRFAAEKQFTRNQLGILYFLVNTLIDNGYLYLKDRDFIALTENGADVINGGECVIPKISLERTIYEKETSGKHGKIDPVGTDEIDPVKTA